MTRKLLVALIVALLLGLLWQWGADRALERWLIDSSRLPSLR